MSIQTCREEYLKALKLGQRESDELAAAGKKQNPEVLDELLPEIDTMTVTDVIGSRLSSSIIIMGDVM